MKVTPIPHGLTLNRPAEGYVRSPGLHMSDIYGDLYKQLEPKRYGGMTPMNPLFMEAGQALEEMLEEGLKRRLTGERPGEFITGEGIIYSPDLLLFADRMTLGEVKLTWMSSKGVPRVPSNEFEPKFDKWLCQMKAYCHHLETPYARLYAFFVNGPGSFKEQFGPELLAWDIVFTARELHDNWNMLLNHARHSRMLP